MSRWRTFRLPLDGTIAERPVRRIESFNCKYSLLIRYRYVFFIIIWLLLLFGYYYYLVIIIIISSSSITRQILSLVTYFGVLVNPKNTIFT